MANRTFLYKADSKLPSIRIDPPITALSAGSNCIPVYWVSLFNKDCIVANKVMAQDGQIFEYPYLVSPTKEAYNRCLDRRSLLASITPSSNAVILDQWLAFINDIDQPFIHLDAAELWMMDVDGFEPHLIHCLEAFENDKTVNNKLWFEMLDAAQIHFDNLEGTAANDKLAGYSWGGQFLPWD